MSRLQVDENRVEWADTEQMIEVKQRGQDIVVYMERAFDFGDEALSLDIPKGDFLHLISELRKKFS